MTGERAVEAVEGIIAGTTTFTARALQRLAVGLTRDAARVPARDVAVHLSDERGALRLSVTVPVAMTDARGGNLVDSGEELRRRLVEGMRALAGREVSTVDVRYSGVRRNTQKRVR